MYGNILSGTGDPLFSVRKENPYHDAQGRFTSKEKAKHHYLQAMTTMEQVLTEMSMSGLMKPDKKMVDQALGQFAKYLGHAADANDVIINVEHFINNLAGSHADKQAILNQVKAIQAGQKAWTKIYKAKAEKFLDEQAPQLWADLATLPSGPGANKQALYIKKKLDHHEQMFLSNGGTQEEWDALMAKADSKSSALYSGGGTPPTPPTATSPAIAAPVAVPAAVPAAPVYEAYQGNKVTWSPPKDVADAKQMNHELGINYYHKRDLYGQDHAFTQLAYAEWQKSKDYLKANDSTFDSSSASAQSKSAYGNSGTTFPKPVKDTIANSGGTTSFALEQSVITASFKVAHITENMASYTSQDLAKANLALNEAKKMAKAKGIQGAALAGLVNKGTNKYKKDGAAYAATTGLPSKPTNSLMTGKLNAAVPVGGYPKILGDSGKLTEYFNNSDPKYFYGVNASGTTGYLEHQFSQRASLTPAERSTILGYSGSDYTKVNHAASKGNPEQHSGAQASKLIESGLAKTTLGADMSLRRNGAQKWFFKAMGISPEKMDHLNDDELQALVGRSYTETAFSSTSRNPGFTSGYSNTAQDSGGIIYRIRAHKDIRGIDLRKDMVHDTLTSHNSEDEVLLDKNLVYRITGIKRISTATHGFEPRYEVFVDAIGHQP